MLKNEELVNGWFCIVGISTLNARPVYQKLIDSDISDINKMLKELNNGDNNYKDTHYFGYKIEKAKLL